MPWLEKKIIAEKKHLPWLEIRTLPDIQDLAQPEENLESELKLRLKNLQDSLQKTPEANCQLPLPSRETTPIAFKIHPPFKISQPSTNEEGEQARENVNFNVQESKEVKANSQPFSEILYEYKLTPTTFKSNYCSYELNLAAQNHLKEVSKANTPESKLFYANPVALTEQQELEKFFDPLHSREVEDFFSSEESKLNTKETNSIAKEIPPTTENPVEKLELNPANPKIVKQAISLASLNNHTPKNVALETERASITPKVKLNRQIYIPFELLHTQKKVLEITNPVETQTVITKLEETLNQFGIEGRVIGIQRGPIITRYELKIAPGIKVNRILSLTDELAMALEALRVRIEAPIPGRSTVGIEIPNKDRAKVLLGDIVHDPAFKEYGGELPLPLGKDIAGNLVLEDLTRLPHLLIAGATGSGKSVAINSFITSLILTKSPAEVRFLLIDPKLVELSHYNDIPHLLHPVITEPQKAILALNWAVEEMERRYEDLAEMRVRDIRSYNTKLNNLQETQKLDPEVYPPMPYIIVLIDELGDLMMVAGKEVEASIIRLAQKARAVGIHLILATQRPSVDVITALIKANCPARIALQVAQKTDSRTILDTNGAEQLVGQGDLLFKHPNRGQLIRVQAPLVEDEEVEKVVNYAKKMGKAEYITLEDPKSTSGNLEPEEEQLFEEAWQIILESGKASASYLQRRLRIGYNRAARLIEAFEARGMIGPQIGSKPREILVR